LTELKNIKKPKGFTIKNIRRKFETTVNDFMSKSFQDVFLDDNYKLKPLRLYFVTNPYGLKEMPHRREGTKMEKLLAMKGFFFKGQTAMLTHKLPSPIIEKC